MRSRRVSSPPGEGGEFHAGAHPSFRVCVLVKAAGTALSPAGTWAYGLTHALERGQRICHRLRPGRFGADGPAHGASEPRGLALSQAGGPESPAGRPRPPTPTHADSPGACRPASAPRVNPSPPTSAQRKYRVFTGNSCFPFVEGSRRPPRRLVASASGTRAGGEQRQWALLAARAEAGGAHHEREAGGRGHSGVGPGRAAQAGRGALNPGSACGTRKRGVTLSPGQPRSLDPRRPSQVTPAWRTAPGPEGLHTWPGRAWAWAWGWRAGQGRPRAPVPLCDGLEGGVGHADRCGVTQETRCDEAE